MFRGKRVIVGTGFVGSAIAYTIILIGIFFENEMKSLINSAKMLKNMLNKIGF